MSTVQCKLTYLSEKAAENVCVPHFGVDGLCQCWQDAECTPSERRQVFSWDLLAT